jgi:hypothetical protein
LLYGRKRKAIKKSVLGTVHHVDRTNTTTYNHSRCTIIMDVDMDLDLTVDAPDEQYMEPVHEVSIYKTTNDENARADS